MTETDTAPDSAICFEIGSANPFYCLVRRTNKAVERIELTGALTLTDAYLTAVGLGVRPERWRGYGEDGFGFIPDHIKRAAR